MSSFLTELETRSGHEKFGSRFYNNLDRTLPVVQATGPSKLEVKIMNYFQVPHPNYKPQSNYNAKSDLKSYDTITTELYCDILRIPHSCRNFLDMAEANTTMTVRNQGHAGDVAYQHIVAFGYRLGYLLPSDEEIAAIEKDKNDCRKKKRKIWCESLKYCEEEQKCAKEEEKIQTILDKITSGGTTSIVGTSSSNITMYKDLSDYHGNFDKRKPVDSLPYLCPEKKQLKKILQRSLQLEKLLMPEFYESPLGEKEHTRLFWDVWLKERKLFCWVDIERLFQNAQTWDEIINQRMVSVDWGSEI